MDAQEVLAELQRGNTLTAIGQFDRDATRLLERLERQGRINVWIDFNRFPAPKKRFRHDVEHNKPLPAAVSF